MNSKSKVFIAVFAAILMIGGALAPIMYSGNNGVAAEETTDGSSFSIVDLIEKLKEQDFDLDFGNGISLIPVGTVAAGEPEVIGTTIDSEKLIASGENKTLTSGSVTTFSNTGIIKVKSGGTLTLFSNPESNYTYQLKNSKDTEVEGNEKVIVMEDGAKFSMFGFTFQISSSGEKPFCLLSIDADDEVEDVDDPQDLTLAFTKLEDGKKRMTVQIYNGKIVTFGNSITVAFNEYKKEVKVGDKTIPADHPDISFTGNLTIEQNTINMTGFFLIDAVILKSGQNDATTLIQGHFRVSKGALIANVDKDTKKISGSLSLNVTNINVAQYGFDNSSGALIQTPLLVINNGSITSGDTDFTIAVNNNEISVDASREEDLVVKVDSIITNSETKVTPENNTSTIKTKTTITNPKLTIDAREVSLTVAVSEKGMGVVKADINTNASMTIEKIVTVITIPEDPENEEKTTTITVTDIAFDANSISVDITDADNGKITVGELSLKGKLNKGISVSAEIMDLNLNYDVNIEMKVTNLVIEHEGNGGNISFNAVAAAKIMYNGKDRTLEARVDGVSIDIDDKSGTMEVKLLTIDRVYVKNDITINVLDSDGSIAKMISALGLGSGQMEVEAKKISSDGKTVSVDYLSLAFKNGIRFKEINIQFNGDLKFDGEYDDEEGMTASFSIASDSINGHITGYDGKVNNFSITDAPEVGLSIIITTNLDNSIGMSASLDIYSGNARFEGGMIPFSVNVHKDTKFYANGLTAPNFIFESGCQKSGTVVIDTNAFKLYSKLNDGMLLKDGDYIIDVMTMNDDKLPGYKLYFNLSDVDHGTIEAKKGYELPASYSNASGFSMTSDDKVTGTFSIQRNADRETIVDVPCERNFYTLSYADDFVAPQQYRFGDVVNITSEIPTKEGKTFIGWSDGSGTLYSSGAEYIMPARDVKLTPVFANVVTPEVVMEGDDKTLVVDASDDLAVIIETDKLGSGDWSKITITVANSKVTFDKSTFNAIIKNDTKYITFWTLKADEFNDEDIEEIVGNKQMFAMKLALINDDGTIDDDLTSNGDTKFQVTVNIFTDKAVKDMKIQYVDQNGYVEEVGVDSYKRCGDGSYDVTFTVNHFSLYAIEPVYENTVTELFILVGLIILIVIICIIVAACFKKKEAA